MISMKHFSKLPSINQNFLCSNCHYLSLYIKFKLRCYLIYSSYSNELLTLEVNLKSWNVRPDFWLKIR